MEVLEVFKVQAIDANTFAVESFAGGGPFETKPSQDVSKDFLVAYVLIIIVVWQWYACAAQAFASCRVQAT